MAEQKIGASTSRAYELPWQYESRIATHHLGSQKYSTSCRALGELVANALDAGAALVDIELTENQLGAIDRVSVCDNGAGMSPADLKSRFVVVGVVPASTGDANRLGRLGVGRLAVHRIGSLSKWTTVAAVSGKKVQSTFTLRTDTSGPLKIVEEDVGPDSPTGTTIEIYNILDTGKERLTTGRIANDLLAQYCSYLLGHPNRRIRVCGEALDVQALIMSRENEVLPASKKVPTEAVLNHLLLRRTVDQSRFPHQVIFSAKGRTVNSHQPEEPLPPQYLGIIECPYLDSIVTSNRELVIEMDEGFASLKEAALGRITEYAKRARAQRKRTFIEQARQEEYYPYRHTSGDPVVSVEQAVYDVALEKIDENANLGNMTRKQQEIVFKLLKRSLENEDLLQVLQEVAKLSDEDVERFRKVLARTTLESIIKLSSEVTNRLTFLDLLHATVYDSEAKKVKERSQLHKIIDPHCWIFGTKFHLATSDKSFREVIRRHRQTAGLPVVDDEMLNAVKGVSDIPDLFMASTRDFPLSPQHHHLLVELKAPNVGLGRKEVEQIRRYADTVLESHEFDKTSTRWDIFLVSSRCSKEIERDRNQKDKPHGVLYEWDNMTLWALEWSEIITNARSEMQLVREHLKRKSEELTISDYLKENFPEILENMTKVVEKDVPLAAVPPLRDGTTG
jgi:hypothetical protein